MKNLQLNLDLTKQQILENKFFSFLYLIDINKGKVEIQKKSFLNIFESNGLSDKEEREAEIKCRDF